MEYVTLYSQICRNLIVPNLCQNTALYGVLRQFEAVLTDEERPQGIDLYRTLFAIPSLENR
jgi:hypothetical protein